MYISFQAYFHKLFQIYQSCLQFTKLLTIISSAILETAVHKFLYNKRLLNKGLINTSYPNDL